MSGDRSKLVKYILEKERKEKAKRKKKIFILGGGAAVLIVSLVVFLISSGVFKSSVNYRNYALQDLDTDVVTKLFQKDKSPIVVSDSLNGRVDTLFSVRDFSLLQAAIADEQGTEGFLETDELNGGTNEEFEPEIGLPTAEGNRNRQPLKYDKPFSVADIMPGFPGGEAALYRFLSEKLRYPPLATKNSVEGKVFVRFVIEKDGSITNASILKGIGYGCDEEAIRVVNAMPKWIPGEVNGIKVPVFSSIAVNFKFL